MGLPLWAVAVAITIDAIVAIGPSGSKRPRAVSVPPPNSDIAAPRAQRFAGLRPSDSSQPVVPCSPGPPNQPKSFCAPCPASTTVVTKWKKRDDVCSDNDEQWLGECAEKTTSRGERERRGVWIPPRSRKVAEFRAR